MVIASLLTKRPIISIALWTEPPAQWGRVSKSTIPPGIFGHLAAPKIELNQQKLAENMCSRQDGINQPKKGYLTRNNGIEIPLETGNVNLNWKKIEI
jgi:hypothetical protein